MAIRHRTLKEMVPLVEKTTLEAFCAKYNHPFLFGREVLEEEFQFNTQVTNELSREAQPLPTTDVFRIRHWVIPLRKPEGAPRRDRIFLGRGETNDVCVPHKTVSKLHAYFIRDVEDADRWFVVDTGSANGTKTNGLRVPPRARVNIADGDTIAFGRCVFQWMSSKSLYERVQLVAPGNMDTSDDF